MIIRLQGHDFLISLRLITLLCIVLCLGLLLNLELWSQPEYLSTKSEFTVPNRLRGSSVNDRSPANISHSALNNKTWDSAQEDFEQRVTALDWDCSSKNNIIHVNNVGQLRLNGKCLKNAKRIVNSKNGYTGSIFQLKDSATTDYMSLDLGSNNLQIEWIDGASSKSSQTLEIIVEKQ